MVLQDLLSMTKISWIFTKPIERSGFSCEWVDRRQFPLSEGEMDPWLSMTINSLLLSSTVLPSVEYGNILLRISQATVAN